MFLDLRLVNTVVIAACLGVLVSCSVYDESQISSRDENATGTSGAVGSGSGGSGNSGIGSGGASGLGSGGASGLGSGGGGAGAASGNGGGVGGGGNAGNGDENDAGLQDAAAIDATGSDEICGNGRVAGAEKCDIGIDSQMPGACPTQCQQNSGCVRFVLEGEGCQAECVPNMPPCGDDDGCCPSAECTSLLDADCSASCGDGKVQEDEGETCEPISALGEGADPGLACPTECPDQDGEPCTVETLLGSEANCNAECSVSTITSLVEGDGCCPAEANANTDGDCDPVCGNGTREADEECDGGEHCDAQCKATITLEQLRCIDDFDIYDIRTDECEACMCTNCTNELLACFDSGDTDLDTLCTNVVRCGYEAGCVGIACFCGSALNPLTGTCLVAEPNGACRTEIEEAAGSTSLATIFLQLGDLGTAVGRSNNVSACFERNCLDICL